MHRSSLPFYLGKATKSLIPSPSCVSCQRPIFIADHIMLPSFPSDVDAFVLQSNLPLGLGSSQDCNVTLQPPLPRSRGNSVISFANPSVLSMMYTSRRCTFHPHEVKSLSICTKNHILSACPCAYYDAGLARWIIVAARHLCDDRLWLTQIFRDQVTSE